MGGDINAERVAKTHKADYISLTIWQNGLVPIRLSATIDSQQKYNRIYWYLGRHIIQILTRGESERFKIKLT